MLLPAPGTPRFQEPMSRRKRFRYWAATGLVPGLGGGVVSVKISVAGGGEVKSLVLIVHLPPTWQFVQPACWNSVRPCATRLLVRRLASGPLGVRTAKRTHSFKAVSAGTAMLLPGSV